MTRSMIRFGIPFMGSALIALTAVFACSNDEKTGGTGTGGTTGTGGAGTGGTATGGGGTATGGGGTGTGGSSGGSGYGPEYTCFNRPPSDPGDTAIANAACCTETLGTGTIDLGTCTAATSITDPNLLASYGHDKCTASPDLRCVPSATALNLANTDAGAATGVFSSCHMTTGGLNLEGRCLPKCFVAGNPLAVMLSQNDCQASLNQVCAPCYNPIDGKATGACTFKSGDAPVEPAPTAFQTCSGFSGDAGLTAPKLGTCIPTTLAQASGNTLVSALKQHDCTSSTDICVPTLKAENLNACFAACTSSIASAVNPAAGPGACVPQFAVLDSNAQGSVLVQDSCNAGEVCAPCLNPLSTPALEPTGACD